MILNFDNFQKDNQSGSKLNNIRIKNLNIFKKLLEVISIISLFEVFLILDNLFIT